MRRRLLLTTLCAGMVSGCSLFAETPSAPTPGKQVLQEFAYKKPDGADAKLSYWLYTPPAASGLAPKKVPFLLFLHGAGERGSNPEVVKKHGPPKLIGKMKQLENVIIVSPQCPAEQWWDVKVLKELCASLEKSLPIDPERRYLTGLSMGGFGTWEWLKQDSKYWAAAIPICGGGDPTAAAKFKDVPIWIFHGAKDEAVPVGKSEEMEAALKKAGGTPKMTIYPEEGHQSWTPAYADAATWEWLLKQKLAAPPKA